MTSKSAPYLSIKQVSEILEIEPHTLRFWETKVTYLSPKKGTGGHRHYSQKDVYFLKNIKHFLKQNGYTIKGLNTLIRVHGIDNFRQESLFSLHENDPKKTIPDKNIITTLEKIKQKLEYIKKNL